MKIGELAALSGATTKTIRFYEQVGVLPEPERTAGGYRDYGPESVDRLRFVRCAQEAGLPLREVRQILAVHDRGEAPCGHVRDLLGERLDRIRAQIAELVALETRVVSLLDRKPDEHDTTAVCWILETDE
ncbi:heavy metal-responsive transcriptional regulator [Kibdelosporangium philippinense]|uniref:Heavy metal-responsive transcriptional regulator n=1 Tax=Kibdelosporangium philippinense TaxID=211113 RepID=A0ABS8Z9M1_9PSEU|nr:heavy metal-responsive transcriptional regulator [Kibdelosporangium philippinense]MCE7004575.1 heavy metal-responsive transcriptional regulator [Kibdelosporangium philippinense]